MRGQACLTEANKRHVARSLGFVRVDVALPAVRDFIAKVKEKAMGEEVISSLSPGQALVGVVQRELAALMGAESDAAESQLSFATQPPAIILMAGLQGVGKTTTVGKLAKFLRANYKKKVLTVSADVYRPADRAIAKRHRTSWCRFLSNTNQRQTRRHCVSCTRLRQATSSRCADRRHGRATRY